MPVDPDDDLLIEWKKMEAPFLPFPPAHMQLTGWRDPFLFVANTGVIDAFGNGFPPPEHRAPTYRMLMGSGIKGKGGAALVYRSSSLTQGWDFEGTLCEGSSEDTGVVWECPLLVPLLPLPVHLRSPHPHEPPRWLVGTTALMNPIGEEQEEGNGGAVENEQSSGREQKSSALSPFSNLPPGARAGQSMGSKRQGQPTVRKHPAENEHEFEFSSGASTPPQPEAHSQQASVELWPYNAVSSATTPVRRALGGAVGNVKSQVASLVASIERLATLEHWKDDLVTEHESSQANGVDSSHLQPAMTIHKEEPTTIIAGHGDGSESSDHEDRFALAHSRVPTLQLRGRITSPGSSAQLSSLASYEVHPLGTAASRQWHLFTVSPDAPTNPVLYWTGFVDEANARNEDGPSWPKFELETAKGPYRLDLGDILYAPNVCQDDRGRWLLWAWLQERRKMGTYAYAGCLTMPRILHVTDEGRLVQAPAPELATLREGRQFHGQHIMLYPDAVVPLQRVRGERLDIECTIERGSASAAGVLFRSHEAEAEGSTAIVYDWDRNQLEAIFNVPPNWQPCSGAPLRRTPSDVFDGFEEAFDPAAYLCNTPRVGISRTPSLSTFSTQHNLDVAGGTGTLGTSSPPSPDLSEGRPSVDLHEDMDVSDRLLHAVGIPGNVNRTGSSLSQCLHRVGSFIAHETSLGGGLARSTSAATTLGSSVPRIGSLLRHPTSLLGSPRAHEANDNARGEIEEDLSGLIENLAAPMRAAEEIPPAAAEPRRVGGPLLMRPSDRLHLRIIVDHSCVEVYTGSGEVLSTRIYRGRGPEGDAESGIDFLAFGGAAILERVAAYEVGSAWGDRVTTPVVGGGKVPSTVSTPAVTPLAGITAKDRANELFDEILLGIGPATVTAGVQ